MFFQNHPFLFPIILFQKYKERIIHFSPKDLNKTNKSLKDLNDSSKCNLPKYKFQNERNQNIF